MDNLGVRLQIGKTYERHLPLHRVNRLATMADLHCAGGTIGCRTTCVR